MITFKYRNYFFPVKALRFHRLMRAAPRWTPERLDAWRSEQKRKVIAHAVATVPFYKDLLSRTGIDLANVDQPENWARLPTVRKEDIRNNADQFVSSSVKPASRFWANTSGSTGMPFKILLDENVNAAAFNLFLRAWTTGGHWKLGQRQAALKGATHESGWRYNRAIRTLELAASHVSAENLDVFYEALRRYEPRLLRGYPSAIFMLCRLLNERNLSLRIPMIVTVAETLHQFQREEIEKTLGARVYNHYTHWERAVSIFECEHGSLHAQEDYAHHEIVDDDGFPVPEGVLGEIVGTGLHNRAMPLIRYRTGDIGVWSRKECECGQVFPVVEKVLGRESDFLVRPDGSLVAATYASSDVKFYRNVVYVQLIQDTPGKVEIRIVPTSEFSEPDDLRLIVDNLRKRLGEEMTFEVRKCRIEDLERSPVGKVRACFARAAQRQLSTRLETA